MLQCLYGSSCCRVLLHCDTCCLPNLQFKQGFKSSLALLLAPLTMH